MPILLSNPHLWAGSLMDLQSKGAGHKLHVRRWPVVIPLAPAMSALRLPVALCRSAHAGSANAQGHGRGEVWAAIMCFAQWGYPSLLCACQPEVTCWSACAGSAHAEHGATDLGAGLPPYPRLTKEAINALRYRGEDVARSLTKTVIKEVSFSFLLGVIGTRQLPLQLCMSVSQNCHSLR